MNKKIFFGFLAFYAFLAWLSGFNFDRRGDDVAVFTFLAIAFSALAALSPGL